MLRVNLSIQMSSSLKAILAAAAAHRRSWAPDRTSAQPPAVARRPIHSSRSAVGSGANRWVGCQRVPLTNRGHADYHAGVKGDHLSGAALPGPPGRTAECSIGSIDGIPRPMLRLPVPIGATVMLKSTLNLMGFRVMKIFAWQIQRARRRHPETHDRHGRRPECHAGTDARS